MIEDVTTLIIEMAQHIEGARRMYREDTLKKLKKVVSYFSIKNPSLDVFITRFEAVFQL